MARKAKKGLSYFPMDIDIFQDIKIRKLIKYQGGKAISVYAYLLCSIYKDGYYMRWDHELPFIVSEVTGYDEAYIHEVIKSCLNIGLFSKYLFDKNQILSSKGIQERFILVMKNLNRVSEIDEFNLISSEETPISYQETIISSEETPISSEFGTQRKEKERKEKEKKIKFIETDVSSPQDFIDQIILQFQNAYREIRAEDYEIMNKGKERSAAAIILALYKKKYPESDSEQTLSGLKSYFLSVCEIKDEWLYRNMSLSIIRSKFNEINQTIKRNGKNINRKTVAERFESADRLIDELYGK